ncbi:hypothetical protein IF2G_00666 [Cordyceps javanica]|nr:hypothetical protein IF2G_00666 [Cordyceps javanica]
MLGTRDCCGVRTKESPSFLSGCAFRRGRWRAKLSDGQFRPLSISRDQGSFDCCRFMQWAIVAYFRTPRLFGEALDL